MLAVERHKFPPFSDEEIEGLFKPLQSLPSLGVAVSGGPDSMALMALLVAWQAIVGKKAPEVRVLSVDHGLRCESKDEVELVARISQQYGLKHQAFTWKHDKLKSNISAQSRDARYNLMCDWCAQQQISHLLVAHTLDDQAETVLLRLARGSGVDGLSAMATSRSWNSTTIYRPLLGVKRSRLLQLLQNAQLPFVDDPSNHDLKYDRVRVRQALKVLKPLGITSDGLAKTADKLAHARVALDQVTTQAISQAVSVYDAGYCILHPRKLEPYSYEVNRRVLGRLLRAVAGHPYAPEQSLLDQLLSWVLAGPTSNRTLGGCFLMPRNKEIWVMRESGRNILPELLLHPGEKAVWDNRIEVSLSALSQSALLVKALGVENYAKLKSNRECQDHYPSALGACLPSFWRNQELIAVPHLNFNVAMPLYQIEADFANSAQLTEA